MTDKKNREITPAASRLPADRELHPMVEKLLATQPDVSTVEKLMKMQEEWEKQKAKRLFTEALVKLKEALPPAIGKDKGADYGQGKPKYMYTTYATVMKTITPHLSTFGFSISTPVTPTDKGLMVRAILTHHAGHSEESFLIAPPDQTGGKNAVQAIGSTITYLQRYLVLSILGLATEDMEDDDGKGVSKPAGSADDTVDPARNMKALQHFIGLGKKKEDVEKFLGKPIDEWTSSDLAKLTAWAVGRQPQPSKPAGGPAPAAPPQTTAPAREPGADESEDLGANLDFHCQEPGCTYHTPNESMLVDHGTATGHKVEGPTLFPKEGKPPKTRR